MGCLVAAETGLCSEGWLWNCLGAGTGLTKLLDFVIGFELLLASSGGLLKMVLVRLDWVVLMGTSRLGLLVTLVGTGSSRRLWLLEMLVCFPWLVFRVLPKLDGTGLDGASTSSDTRLPASGSSSAKLGREPPLYCLREKGVSMVMLRLGKTLVLGVGSSKTSWSSEVEKVAKRLLKPGVWLSLHSERERRMAVGFIKLQSHTQAPFSLG